MECVALGSDLYKLSRCTGSVDSVTCPQAKAYTTRVGAGPYPTEIHGAEAEELRKVGQEYGTTTGRPRRVGWLDIPALRYAARSAFFAHPTIWNAQHATPC